MDFFFDQNLAVEGNGLRKGSETLSRDIENLNHGTDGKIDQRGPITLSEPPD